MIQPQSSLQDILKLLSFFTIMPYRITQCYVPPDRGDIPAFTPAEAGIRLSDPGGMEGLAGLLRTEMVYPHEDAVTRPSTYYFASAAVAVDSSRMTASSSASWSRYSSPSNFVNGPMSTMWFMVCRWPQSQEGDWARPHLCKVDDRGLDLSGNGSSETMYDEGNRNLAVG